MKSLSIRFAAPSLPRPAAQAIRRVAAATAAFAAAGLVAWQAAAHHASAHSALGEAGRRHAEVAETLRLVDDPSFRNRLAVFTVLEARGLIGDERRAEWIALLDRMAGGETPSAFAYELSPAQPPAAADEDALRLRRSILRLDMELLHEGDLIAVLDELTQRIAAIVRVHGCEIARSGKSEAADRPAPLAASCRLELLTVASVPR